MVLLWQDDVTIVTLLLNQCMQGLGIQLHDQSQLPGLQWSPTQAYHHMRSFLADADGVDKLIYKLLCRCFFRCRVLRWCVAKLLNRHLCVCMCVCLSACVYVSACLYVLHKPLTFCHTPSRPLSLPLVTTPKAPCPMEWACSNRAWSMKNSFISKWAWHSEGARESVACKQRKYTQIINYI